MKYFDIADIIFKIVFILLIISPFISFVNKYIHNSIKASDWEIKNDYETWFQKFFRLLATKEIFQTNFDSILKISSIYCLLILASFIASFLLGLIWPLFIFFLIVVTFFYLISKLSNKKQ